MTIMIETDRLVLKTSTRENFQQVFLLLSDPDVMRYIGNGPRTENEVRNGLGVCFATPHFSFISLFLIF